ncbi:hypothetical protein EV182_006492 [Spiromyces aspiralis]|uniref:Uncharacterized protein n=1 Tax=Spiromyces aspiralis TaxID=68401 RepID=A0ACC1H8N9_9FUNG|nr:hypothetical protein EV182_006492 [Spiromyces aspiralis]
MERDGSKKDIRRRKSNDPRSLQVADGIRCCFSFTVRRDKYKIPISIIGNFMPIQPNEIRFHQRSLNTPTH